VDLTGRKVLITGANRGVGAAFVSAALARQAATVVAAARYPASLPAFPDPGHVVPARLDVTDRDQVAALASEHPDVDLLISNAGVTCQRPLLSDITDAALREVMEVNFFGPLSLARTLARSAPAGVRPHLRPVRQRRGAVAQRPGLQRQQGRLPDARP
jgi:NAD(P)-dependent dehydrogenase (short-subunit alcohol dehydrogenase family)